MGSNNQKGFTLIELVVVIVILGILAATALPKFIDLSGDAKTAAMNGYAGAISSGSSINYAAKLAGNAKAITIATCTDASALVEGTLPAQYTLSGGTTTAGQVATCNLSNGTSTVTVSVTGA